MTLPELYEAVKKQGEELDRLRIVVAELVERVAQSQRDADEVEEWLREKFFRRDTERDSM